MLGVVACLVVLRRASSQALFDAMSSSQPVFDERTGAPLNEAASAIVAAHDAERTAPPPAQGSSSSSSSSTAQFDAIPAIGVAEGTWKFVLLEISLGGETRLIVRAIRGKRYHADNFEETRAKLRPLGIRCCVVGGGRIKRDSNAGTIDVYGFSKTFGRAPGANEKTAELIRANLRGYRVAWSDEGY